MKKLYVLLLACLTTVSVYAVNLKFFIGDTEITPGSKVYFKDYQAEEYESGVWDILMNPRLSVESDFFTNAVTITATCTSGQDIQMCAGGTCEKGQSVVKENLTLRKGQKLALEFEFLEGEYEGAVVPDVVTTFKAEVAGGNTVEFTLVMGPSAASVSSVEISDRVSFTDGAIRYDLHSTRDFALYSLTGTCVLSDTLKGSGVLSTAGLPTGIYVYTLDGKAGKIVVK